MKYGVWLQQKGKAKLQCQKEYILLLAQHDPFFNETVQAVANGDLTEIANPNGEKGFAKTVSTIARGDPTEYVATLTPDEKTIFGWYEAIAQGRDEVKLDQCFELGVLKKDSVNKEEIKKAALNKRQPDTELMETHGNDIILAQRPQQPCSY